MKKIKRRKDVRDFDDKKMTIQIRVPNRSTASQVSVQLPNTEVCSSLPQTNCPPLSMLLSAQGGQLV